MPRPRWKHSGPVPVGERLRVLECPRADAGQAGPDRVARFSDPGQSQVSDAAGTRFLPMIGGTILAFCDWYADMPNLSPRAGSTAS